jgi:hypothetical protein
MHDYTAKLTEIYEYLTRRSLKWKKKHLLEHLARQIKGVLMIFFRNSAKTNIRCNKSWMGPILTWRADSCGHFLPFQRFRNIPEEIKKLNSNFFLIFFFFFKWWKNWNFGIITHFITMNAWLCSQIARNLRI